MANLETSYLGLKLKNPVVVSSSGLTNSVSKIKKCEENGAGAVVLKSLFEEQITGEIQQMIQQEDSGYGYPEAEEYIANYVRGNSVSDYLSLIKEAKSAVDIPVIASINCVSSADWTTFAKDIEKAGADAIELNIFIVPNDKNTSAETYEKQYLSILKAVKKEVAIPVAIKLGMYFTNLLSVADQLNANNVDGLVLFNRFYEPDIDIHNLKITSCEVLSSPNDMRKSLRWVGMLSAKIKGVDIAASTGIHNSEAAVKQLLAGASVVQICSVVYEKGFEQIKAIVDGIAEYMDGKGFHSMADIKGKLDYHNIPDSALYERSQFMKYFSNNKLNQ